MTAEWEAFLKGPHSSFVQQLIVLLGLTMNSNCKCKCKVILDTDVSIFSYFAISSPWLAQLASPLLAGLRLDLWWLLYTHDSYP